jgi:large subunit ribosomal protein L5
MNENPMARSKVEKVVVGIGVGKALTDPKWLEIAAKTLETVTGQKAQVTRAKKAVASFKVRQGAAIGLKVTLRGKRMNNFVEKLAKIILPRVRDFKGLKSNHFDSMGNYTIGFPDQIAFPEVRPDDIKRLHGLEVTIVTTAKNDEEGKVLLSDLGFPFEKEGK